MGKRKFDLSPENMEKLTKEYQRTGSIKMAGELLGISLVHTWRIFKKKGIPMVKENWERRKKFSIEQIEEMKRLFGELKSIDKFYKLFNTSPQMVRKVLRENGVDTSVDSHWVAEKNRKYKIDETFFEKVDNRDKAYILGIWSSDGHVHSKLTNLKLRLTDIKLVEDIRDRMNYDRPLYYKTLDGNRKKTAELTICNYKLHNDIQKLGIGKNKTIHNSYPTTLNGFDADFIRGYFDGDGCISIKQQKTSKSANVSMICTQEFAEGLQKILLQNGINSKIYEDKRHNKAKFIRILSINAKPDIIKFGQFIYKDLEGQLYLERKQSKFKEVVIVKPRKCQ